jgi:UDP-GlcNAc3NAcA epimerase
MELRLITTPPLGYLDMLALVQAAGYVVTDSGGLSREAFFFQKPSVTVMKQMFWPEISLHGPSLAAAADTDSILTTFCALQGPLRSFDTRVFGDGHAAEKIGRLILNHLHG